MVSRDSKLSVFYTCVSWWSSTGVWVTASLLKPPRHFWEFDPILIRLWSVWSVSIIIFLMFHFLFFFLFFKFFSPGSSICISFNLLSFSLSNQPEQQNQILISLTIPYWLPYPPSWASSCTPFVIVGCIRLLCVKLFHSFLYTTCTSLFYCISSIFAFI